jgi:hypothetical protein
MQRNSILLFFLPQNTKHEKTSNPFLIFLLVQINPLMEQLDTLQVPSVAMNKPTKQL